MDTTKIAAAIMAAGKVIAEGPAARRDSQAFVEAYREILGLLAADEHRLASEKGAAAAVAQLSKGKKP